MRKFIAIIIPLIFGLIFLAAGIFIALETAVPTFSSWYETRDWLPVKAELTSVGGTDSSTTATYRYQSNGGIFEGSNIYHATFNDNIGSYHSDLRQRLNHHKQNNTPITIWVSTDDPRQSILDNSMRWGLFSLISAFCLVFILVGLFVVLICLTKKSAPKKEPKISSSLDKTSDYQSRKGWATKHIRSEAKKSLGFFWIFALLWNGICFPVLIPAYNEIMKGDYALLLVFIFPLAGMFLLYKAISGTLEYKRFGVVELCMDPYPGAIGGHLGGTIKLDNLSNEHLDSKFEVEAQCVYTYVSGSGKNRSRKENIVWAEKGNARPSIVVKGLELEFRFTIPNNLPEADIQQTGRYHFWRLNVTADLPGIDLNRSYNIPVFKTGKTSFHVRHDISEQVVEQNKVESAKVDAAIARQDFKSAGLSKTVSIKSDGRELRMVFPMFRNKLLSIFALIFGVSFSGATIAINSDFSFSSLWTIGYVLFSLPFAAIGLIGSISAIYLLFNRLHVSIKEGHVTALRTLFIIPIYYKKIDKYQVGKLTLKQSGSSGQGTQKAEYFKIKLLSKTGEQFTIAETIKGKDTAEHFKDYLIDRIRMC